MKNLLLTFSNIFVLTLSSNVSSLFLRNNNMIETSNINDNKMYLVIIMVL